MPSRSSHSRRGHLDLGLAVKATALVASSALLGSAVLLGPAPKKAAKAPPAPAKPASFERDVKPFVTKYCASCHGQEGVAGFSVTRVKTVADLTKAGEQWRKARTYVHTLHMPPKGMAQPTKAERLRFVAAVDAFTNVECKLAEPGRVTLRRLNRAEYNNTVRDLLGLELRPADDFPSDDVGYGFDNIGDVLSMSPLLMEKYLAAAETIAAAAIRDRLKPMSFTGGEMRIASKGGAMQDGVSMYLYSDARVIADPVMPRQGLYNLEVEVVADQAGDEKPKLEITAPGQSPKIFDVTATRFKPETIVVPFKATGPGAARVEVAFLNDYFDPDAPDDRKDRNVAVRVVRIVPRGGDLGSPSENRLGIVAPVPGKEAAEARRVLSAFARRAYRRPPTGAETDRLVKLFEYGRQLDGTYEAGLRLGLQAILTSPSFLFRVETDPKTVKGGKRLLSPYELATRLSYFLWSSTPDDRLLELAASGAILKPDVLAAETRRMMKDPRSAAMADNFAEQWLTLRKLQSFHPDPKQFPQFDETLRASMLNETKTYFRWMLAENRPVTEFLDSKVAFVNAPLAKLYGIPGVAGDDLKKVSLSGDQRGGLLSQGAVLAVTSNPTRTSPVKRGKWVLENILGTPPPPPPPGVGDLGDDAKILTTKDLRKRMEAHRKKPDCFSCHSKMDPIGFGMENYDAIGRWRTKDGDVKIDSSGVLPDGRKFAGPAALKGILLEKKDQFAHTLADRLLTFGLGRGMELADKCALDAIVKTAKGDDLRFQTLVIAVVQSEPFRMRTVEKKP